ncbi:MAG: glycosyltransferase family 4 protein [Thermoplasmata archaeon]|nr:glycosyltransferase family 4 protein [Thermoplasmata archaeon]
MTEAPSRRTKGRTRAARVRTTGGRPKPHTRRAVGRSRESSSRTSGKLVRRDRSQLEALTSTLAWRRTPEETPSTPPRVPVRKLHIVMVGWEYPPNHTGGLGVHCYELCRELGRMGHRITFLTPFHGPFTETQGVSFRWPGRRTEGEPPVPFAYQVTSGPAEPGWDTSMNSYNDWVGSLAGLKEVDVVHVHDWFGTRGGVALSRRMRRPLVMTIHSTEYDRTLGFPGAEIREHEAYGLQRADRVIAVSRHLKQQVVDRYGVPPGKVRVVYNAVRPTPRLERLRDAGVIVLYLGRLAAMKGVDTFLRAAARVAPLAPAATFVVAGEGPELPRLLTLSAHLGISDRVLFLGKVTEEERSLLLAGASVFVLPSVVEPFGIAALEAMAAGVPTIVSKTSGVAEITENTFAVDFWDIDEFASRIGELLQYPELRRLMGDASRWEALKAGWPERALETVGVYVELLDAAGSRP